MEITDWINIAYILIVLIVFIIQHFQIKKQNNLLNYYDRIFTIIKIDEIEKYVKLKEDNIKLAYDNKSKTVNNLLERSEKLSNDAEYLVNNLSKLEHANDKTIQLIELNKEKITECYNFYINEIYKIKDEELKKSMNDSLSQIFIKYQLKRDEIQKEKN